MLTRSGLLARVQSLRPRYEAALRQLVELRSVSADPERKPDVLRTAKAACALIESFGGTARAVETAGNPVVVGALEGPRGAPAVTFYNHLDVQPADPGEWRHAPFTFTVEGDRYGGRGATDDKGPALAALFGAALAREANVPATARFVWELEEEIGSPSFGAFLNANAAELACESVVVSDTIWISRERPAIPYALRGMLTALMRLETAAHDTHSGDSGGVLRNPIAELCAVIAQCIDVRTGAVTIPGFNDDVAPPTPAEIESFVASGFDVGAFRRTYELKHLYSDDLREVLQRMWSRPTFEVHGIAGGYQGAGVKSVVPPRAEAKVSMRLVPNQDPAKVAEQLRAHVRRINPDVEMEIGHGLAPYAAPFSGPQAEAARDAYRFAFGVEPALVREGGSIGPALPLAETLRAPVLFLGLSLPEHGYHAPNECFDWGQASGGMLAFARYLELAAAR